MVNIVIAGHNDFHCPVGRKVEEVVNVIRSGRGLIYGEIERNGEAMFPNDSITPDGSYQFVNFQYQQGIAQQQQMQESVEDLLVKAGIISIDKKTLDRMNHKFTNQVLLALRTKNSNLAKKVYEMAELLPETQTAERLKTQSNIVVDCSLYGNNNQFIQICFNKGIPSVLKTVTSKEYQGMIALEQAMIQHPNIISWTLPPKDSSAKPNKCFVVMPLMPMTMENLYGILEEMAEKMFLQIGSALTYLHDHGFVHMDVKPSNICIDMNGSFILIDLGSCCKSGYESSSTPGYYPTDWDPNPARPETDWWMLSVSIYDKLNNVGEGITIDERTHQSCDRLLDWFSTKHSSLSGLIFDKLKV